MKCLKIVMVSTVRILEDFFRLKLEMETREEKYNEKKKENAKDVKSRYHKQHR